MGTRKPQLPPGLVDGDAGRIGQIERARTRAQVLRFAARLGVEVPITQVIARVISGEIKPVEAFTTLAQRPLRAEQD